MNEPPEVPTAQHDGSASHPSGTARTSPATAPRRRRRRLIIAGVVILVIAFIVAFLAIAPRYIARYVANHYLTGMQIDVEGVKTIDIDLFNGEVSIGPVRFHSGTADPGTIGRLGVKLSLSNLIHRQALLSAVVLRDVDVSIRQTPDGEILVNGISLRQMMAEKAEQEEQPKAPDDTEKSGWGAGIDDLSVRNTRVHFTNRTGGTAAVTIDRLDLRGFRTWEPDHPGTFVLTGNVNGAEVTVYGRAQPFGEKITVFSELTVNGVDLTGIEEFTGPLPLTPAAGMATAYARNTIDLEPDGHLSGNTTGTVVLSNIDVNDPEKASIKLDQVATDVDLRFALDPEGAAQGSGRVQVRLNEGSSALPDGTSLTLPSLALDLSDLSFRRAAAGAIEAATQVRVQVDTPQLSGPADVRAEQVVLSVPRIEAQVTADGTTTVRLPEGENDEAKSEEPKPAETQPGQDVTHTAGAELSIERGSVALADASGRPATTLDLATFTATVAKLNATLIDGAITANGTAGAGIEGLVASLAGEGDSGSKRLAADGLQLKLDPVSVTTRPNGATMVTSGALQLAGLSAKLPAAGEQAATQIDGRDAELNFRNIELKSDSANGAQITGTLDGALRDLEARVPVAPDDPPFEITLASLRVGLSDTSVSSRGADADLTATLETSLDKFAAVQPTRGGSASKAGERLRTALDSLRLTLSPLDIKTRGDQLSVSTSGTTEVQSVTQELPKSQQKPAAKATIDSVRAYLNDITAKVAPDELRWQVNIDAQVDQLAAAAEDGKAASLTVKTVSIGDLSANSEQQVSIGRQVIDRLQAFVTRDYLQGSAEAPESRPKKAAQAVESAAQEGWKVRIGSLSVTNDSAIQVRDTTVEPNANFNIAIKTLQVQNIDMIDPTQHTQMRLDASINEFSELAVAGWAAPFTSNPDFDLNARLQRLELPPLSPYAAPAVGVNIESGQLNLDAKAAAKAGDLNGDLELTLRDLNFSALSAEDAKRLSAAVGVPIETIVGLLQDDQGRIRLNIPISGNLNSPSFDPSDAIAQAMTGAVQAAVLAPFQLAFAPVSLIAKAAGGGPMTFQPIPFAPGEAELTSEGRDMIAGLARVLQERNKLQIKVCGQATAADLNALAGGNLPPSGPEREAQVQELRPKLEALASERTAAARRALISDGDVGSDQVGECRSAFNPTDQKPPRANVGL